MLSYAICKSRRNKVRRPHRPGGRPVQAVHARDDCSKHSMVRAVGLEPTRSFEHRHLKPARQPVAPRPQARSEYRVALTQDAVGART